MQFDQFATSLQTLENTSARLGMTAQLAVLLRALQPGPEVTVACYLLQGQLVPPYQSLEFQLSTKLILRVLARLGQSTPAPVVESLSLFPTAVPVDTTGESPELAAVTKRYQKLGDLGQLAEEIMAGQPTSQVDVVTVYEKLVTIARTSGAGSQDQKQQQLQTLLGQLDALSAKFVIRIILGKLRLGFATMTLMDALSWAQHGDKRDRQALEFAYQKKADIGKLAAAYLSVESAKTHEALELYQVETGVPVVPALCQRLNTAAEIIAKMPVVYAEPKYDGLRLQIHIDVQAGWVKAYTRNLEEVTAMFPELLETFKLFHCQSCIIDSEAVGYDPVTAKILPFQETITRKRKHEIAEQAKSVPIRCFVFDVMAIDNQSLMDEPLSIRKQRLQTLFTDSPTLEKALFREMTDPVALKAFHEAELAKGLEGVVVKQIDSVYRSGRKGWRWVKIKEQEGTSGKLSDTIDCIVMGYYFGKGKRTSFGVGAFLLGVLGKEKGELVVQSVAKLGTGLTDVEFASLRQVADQHRVETAPDIYQVPSGLVPDGWLEPSVVLEIAADEITKSPTHMAGVSLRFPRLVRVRTDKSWEQATTITELAEIRTA
jgi:DNA ligase-1